MKFRPFQIGLLAGFALVGLLSLVVLASFRGFSANFVNPYGEQVIIWGTLDESVILEAIQVLADSDDSFRVVDYVEKDPRTFEDELVNAIAENRAPDAIMLMHEDLVTYRPKLQPIPYETISLRFIRDTYIDGAEIFALADGLYALPFAVDPLVMYWSRDLFAAGGFALPPATWESLSDITQRLTLRDATRNILQSTIAFGEYQNVENAKPALLTLLMQSGSQMIEETDRGYAVTIDESRSADALRPLNASLQFFVEFSNANSPLYSWNRSEPSDLLAFLSEELALYFGFGSEAVRIVEQNPNLNFDSAPVPQGAGATVLRTYGQFYGLALLRSSRNPQGTYRALTRLVSPDVTAAVTERLNLAPTERATIAAGTPNSHRQIVFNSALLAHGWLDPGREESDNIFSQMVEDVVSNRLKVSNAATDAVRRLELAF